jgi:hypothetical protein
MSEDDGHIWVKRARYSGLTKEETEVVESDEPIKVPNFNNLPTAKVSVSGHMTKNLGNYESARVGVEISLPCLPVESEVVRVYGELQELVGEMLTEQLSEFDVIQ